MKNEEKKVGNYIPDYDDKYLPAQIAEIMQYGLDYSRVELVPSKNGKIEENDTIIFLINDNKKFNEELCRNFSPDEAVTYEKTEFSSRKGVPYFFVTRFLCETKSHLYFWHQNGVRRVPLDWLRPIEGTENKLYEKITSIILHPEVGNA